MSGTSTLTQLYNYNMLKEVKDSIRKMVKKSGDAYVDLSDVAWLRGLIQSINVPIVINGVNTSEIISWGQYLDNILFAAADSIRKRRLEETLRNYGERIIALERSNELDTDSVGKDIESYCYLFRNYLAKVVNEHRVYLRNCYTNLIVNFSSKKYSSEENKDFYFNLVVSLVPDQLLLLTLAIEYLGETDGEKHEKSKTLQEHLVKALTEKGREEGAAQALIKDLIGKGLMNDNYTALFGGNLYTLYVSKAGRQVIDLIS